MIQAQMKVNYIFILLVIMGINYLIKKDYSLTTNNDKLKTKSFFLQGFLINFVNPFVFMVWIGVLDYSENSWGMSNKSLL